MQSLLHETRLTLAHTKNMLREVERQISPILAEETPEPDEVIVLAGLLHDKKILCAMISSLTFQIQWLKTGRQPGTKRGIERRAAYEKEVSIDTDTHVFQVVDTYALAEEEVCATTIEKEQLVKEMLQPFTKRQKEVLALHADHHTETEIAAFLGITQQRVSQILCTCKEKIEAEGWFMA